MHVRRQQQPGQWQQTNACACREVLVLLLDGSMLSGSLLQGSRLHRACMRLKSGRHACGPDCFQGGSWFSGQGAAAPRVAQVPIAQIPCHNEGDGTEVKFVDCHNGWGLTALHIAVFQGSVNTGVCLCGKGGGPGLRSKFMLC